MAQNGQGRKCMNDNNINYKCFIDTNLIIYTCDESDLEKQNASINFLNEVHFKAKPVISTQTLGEFFNVAFRKLNFTKEDAILEVQRLANSFPVYEISTENVLHAMKISKETQYSYWDSLIIAMAIDTGCSVLYSEDLNNGQEIEGLKIINPFTVE